MKPIDWYDKPVFFYISKTNAMFIHQSFKDDLKTIRPDLKTKFWLEDVDALPDETLIQKLLAIFTSGDH